MTSQYRHRRSSDPTKTFPQLEPGEIAVNTANRQLALGDAASGAVGNPLQLLPLRFFDNRAIYAAGDLVYYQNVVYRSIGVSGPGAFTPGQWTMLVGVIDAQYVAKAGDTMTGALTLSGNPSDGLHAAPKQYVDTAIGTRIADTGDTMSGPLALPAPTDPTHATNKAYVDSALANKSSVVSSDTPPPAPVDNTLWFETDTGLLYVRYNDGNSTQWVIACPQPDTSLFVQRTGDVMSGALTLPADPTLALQASTKQYADKTAKTYSGKNYIINGAMMVSQENGATAGTASLFHAVDQFVMAFGNAGTQTVQQVASATPGGSPNRLRVTATVADASVAAADYCQIAQPLEGLRTADLRFGSANAKTITIQFGVKAPAGTYCVGIHNTAANRCYAAEYVIAAGEANTDVVKSVTIVGDKTGTWLSDNTVGIFIRWSLMAGTSSQQPAGVWGTTSYGVASPSQFNFMGTVGNVFELFDVSLTEGTVAPPFVVPDYADELLACKRYWQKAAAWNSFIATSTGQYHDAGVYFSVPFRSTPTVAIAAWGARANLAAATVVDPHAESGCRHSIQSTAAGYAYAQLDIVTGNARL